MRRGPAFPLFLLIAIVIVLSACGPAQPNIEATQTRAVEVAQLATVMAPTAALVASTVQPPMATLAPSGTPVPPAVTPTPIATATPLQPTSTPEPDYAALHAQYFAQQQRTVTVIPIVVDVTGDYVPEYLYVTTEPGGCNKGGGGLVYCYEMVTVFSNATAIFDSANGEPRRFREGVLALPLASGTGFQVVEPATPNIGETTWTYVWDKTAFTQVAKEQAAVPTPPPTSTPSAEALRATLLHQIDVYEREVYKPYSPADTTRGDWRPFYLKLESWLPQYPEFGRYYSWRRQRPYIGDRGLNAPYTFRDSSTLEEYLAGLR